MEHSSHQKNKYVYHLIDSTNGLPFYVGKGHENRMYEHELKVRKGIIPNNNKHLFHKIKKVISNGMGISYLKVADGLNDATALALEMMEITRIGKNNLCNLTDGGEGISGLKHSQKSKHIMSKKRYAWFNDPSHRKQTSEATREGMISSGWIDKVSKEISMVSPDGNVIIARNISKFCRDNNLQNGNVYKVLRGKIKYHRGWSLPTEQRKV